MSKNYELIGSICVSLLVMGLLIGGFILSVGGVYKGNTLNCTIANITSCHDGVGSIRMNYEDLVYRDINMKDVYCPDRNNCCQEEFEQETSLYCDIMDGKLIIVSDEDISLEYQKRQHIGIGLMVGASLVIMIWMCYYVYQHKNSQQQTEFSII